MAFKQSILALGILVAVTPLAMAQGTVRGAEDGVRAGDRAAGPGRWRRRRCGRGRDRYGRWCARRRRRS